MHTKKLLSFLICGVLMAAMLIGVTACGNKQEDPAPTKDSILVDQDSEKKTNNVGWNNVNIPFKDVEKEVSNAFEEGMKQVDEELTPVTYLAFQLASGVNYKFLCTDEDLEEREVIVYTNKDGKVVKTEITKPEEKLSLNDDKDKEEETTTAPKQEETTNSSSDNSPSTVTNTDEETTVAPATSSETNNDKKTSKESKNKTNVVSPSTDNKKESSEVNTKNPTTLEDYLVRDYGTKEKALKSLPSSKDFTVDVTKNTVTYTHKYSFYITKNGRSLMKKDIDKALKENKKDYINLVKGWESKYNISGVTLVYIYKDSHDNLVTSITYTNEGIQ